MGSQIRKEQKEKIERLAATWLKDREARVHGNKSNLLSGFNAGAESIIDHPEEVGLMKASDEWISMESGVLPRVGEDVGFIVVSDNPSINGRRMGGRYMGLRFGYHEFSVPGHGWEASHWCKLPDKPQPPKV